jgi:CRP-like cAMP-binding protein
MKTELSHPPAEARNELLNAIAAHPFCRGLDEKMIRTLSDSAMLIDFAKDQLIFREGDMANRFYLIRVGKVALESRSQNQEPVLVQHIWAGDVLGWSWLFSPYYWHFDARAVEPTKAIFLYGTRLREQCEENPALGFALMKRISKVVIDRLQATRRQLI